VYYDLNDFLRLSALLNMQLCAAGVWRDNVIAVILGRKSMPRIDQEVLHDVLEYLDAAYGRRRRHVGSLAVLHPLRATALLARALETPTLLDLLTELLHDKLEDISVEQVGQEQADDLEARFQSLLKRIDPEDEWLLMERLSWLTRRPEESYFQYVGRLLDHASRTPALMPVKLADRLDNTLDMRIDVEDPMQGVDFFQTVFEVMFVNGYAGYRADSPHPPNSPVNGAQRLYQLFKNAVLLSVLRNSPAAQEHPAAPVLMEALATASMREAQRIALHIFAYHETDVQLQRGVLMEALEHAQTRSVNRASFPHSERRLDRLFVSVFEHTDRDTRERNLEQLYHDKPLMLEAALSFVVTFLSFLDTRDQARASGVRSGWGGAAGVRRETG
jgi:hypothetical protein